MRYSESNSSKKTRTGIGDKKTGDKKKKKIRDMLSSTVIIRGIGFDDLGSNPGEICLSYTSCLLSSERHDPSNLFPAMSI